MNYGTIAELVETNDDVKAGSNYSWQAFTNWTKDDQQVRSVYHYSTLMLEYVTEDDGYTWDGNVDTVHYSLGHGSVSDQNGMNRLFRATGIPAYYERAGGAGLVWLPRERAYA